MSQKQGQTVTINDVPYNFNDLSQEAKNQVLNLRITDQEIEHLKQKLAIAQTARLAYAKALENELPAVEKASVQ
jgi:hypothetical protein